MNGILNTENSAILKKKECMSSDTDILNFQLCRKNIVVFKPAMNSRLS